MTLHYGSDGEERVDETDNSVCRLRFFTAMIAMIEKYRKGEFNPYTADEDDEEAIGNIVILWWLYIYQRLTERSE